jgi:hypothetical protein
MGCNGLTDEAQDSEHSNEPLCSIKVGKFFSNWSSIGFTRTHIHGVT